MPFTELSKRIDENNNPLPGYEPYNQIDNIALHHDVCYRDSDLKKNDKTRNDCDKIMLDELNAIKTKGIREKLDYALVKPIIWLKYKLGLGIHENIQLAKELHAPIRSKFKRRRVMVYSINDIWSADLKDMQSLAKYNKGYKYLLNVIDLFSRYVYSIPLKSKSSHEIMNAFKQLFLKKQPNKLWTDRGSEFINNQFTKFLKDNNIELYHTYNEGKAVVIERFNRTLGEMIQKHMTSTNSNKYIHVLQKLIDDYNNKYHTSIKMTPHKATKNTELCYNNQYSNIKVEDNNKKYKLGDRVKIYRYKNTFEKGYKPNWTREIFVINEIRNTNPITYRVKDLSNEPILGSFYVNELHATKL